MTRIVAQQIVTFLFYKLAFSSVLHLLIIHQFYYINLKEILLTYRLDSHPYELNTYELLSTVDSHK